MSKKRKLKALSGTLAVSMLSSTFSGLPINVSAEESNTEFTPIMADSYVKEGTDNTDLNFGSEEKLLLTADTDLPDDAKVAYIKFDISALDKDTITGAKLVLSTSSTEAFTISLFEAQNSWLEEDITWTNQPQIVDQNADGAIDDNDMIAMSGTPVIEAKELENVIINALKSGKKEITFAIYLNKGADIEIASKETDAPSELVISKVDADTENFIKSVNNYNQKWDFDYNQDDLDVLSDLYNLADTGRVPATVMTKYNQLQNAGSVKVMIDALNMDSANAENYTEFKKAILDAQDAYNKLSYYGKATLGNKEYQILVSAENKYKKLQEDDILSVNSAIDAIGKISEYSPELDDDGKLIISDDNIFTKSKLIESANAKKNAFLARLDKCNEVVDTNLVLGYLSTEDIRSIIRLSVLDEANQTKDILVNDAADEFKNAWDEIRPTINEEIASENHDSSESAKNFLTQFTQKYYNEIITTSAYFDTLYEKLDTTEEGYVNDNYLDDYLRNNFIVDVDILRHAYGDDETIENKDIDKFKQTFSDYCMSHPEINFADRIYVYLSKQRSLAENDLSTYLHKSNITLSDADSAVIKSSEYCDKIYELLMEMIGKDTLCMSKIDSELKSADFSKTYIDKLTGFINNLSEMDDGTKQYIQTYDSSRWEMWNKAISTSKSDLAVLSKQELDHYAPIKKSITDFKIDFKSGYLYNDTSKIGTKDSSDKYWTIDDFITERNNDISNVDYDTLKYYYDALSANKDADIKVLDTNVSDAKGAISALDSHKANINLFRASAEAANKEIDIYDNMLLTNNVDFVGKDFSKYEEYVSYITNLDLSVEQIEEGYLSAKAKIDEYNKAKINYTTVYASEEFFDFREPYMSAESLKLYEETLKNDILDPKPVINMSEFIDAVNNLYDKVTAFDKSALYLSHTDFKDVMDAKETLSTLTEQYNSFSESQKYYITSDAVLKLSVVTDELGSWDKAINVMNLIDAIDGASSIEKLNESLILAKDAYSNLSLEPVESVDLRAKALIADEAINKLNAYEGVSSLYKAVFEFGPIFSQAQLDSEPELIELRTSYNKLALTITSSPIMVSINAQLTKTENEMEMAKLAKNIDEKILALDNISDLDELYTAFTAIDIQIFGNGITGDDKVSGIIENNPLVFGMLLQYAKFDNYKDNFDSLAVQRFVNKVCEAENIDYTSDFSEMSLVIADAFEMYAELTQNQLKYSDVPLAYSNLLEYDANLKKCIKAMENSKDVIDDINSYLADSQTTDENQYEIVNSNADEIQNTLDSWSSSELGDDYYDAYNYLLSNGYVGDFNMARSEFDNYFKYYLIKLEIEKLWAEAQGRPAAPGERPECHYNGVEIKLCEDAYEALLPDQKEKVSNYSKLVWIRMQFDREGSIDVIDLIDSLPDADSAKISDIAAIENAIAQFEALSEENQKNVTNLDKLDSLEQLLMEMKANLIKIENVIPRIEALPTQNEDETDMDFYKRISPIAPDIISVGNFCCFEIDKRYYPEISNYNKLRNLIDLLPKARTYAKRGGKPGDVDNDGTVTISDIVMIVDHAIGKTSPADLSEALRADVLYDSRDPENSNIDVNDVVAAIDLLDF